MKSKTVKYILLTVTVLFLAVGITVFALEYFSDYTVTKTINQGAPVKIIKTVKVNAPVEKVWRILVDVNGWDTWQKDIESPNLNGSFEPGSSFDWKTNGLSITSTLHTVETNESLGWSGPAFGAFAIHNWYLSEQNGQTIIRVEESMEGWLVKLLDEQFQSTLDTSTENWLNYLKIEAEK